VAELVDAPASGAGDRKVVEVRVLSWAPFRSHAGAAVDILAIAKFTVRERRHALHIVQSVA
jgi:hypothetical protein